ncbi:no mitochondrial derivative [Oratosquilla oratoria]|uniref:no mitochondrial derivative n=1 Tax=Oratosquilla oratoria TaxID=337810 RepID=UPI003F763DDE
MVLRIAREVIEDGVEMEGQEFTRRDVIFFLGRLTLAAFASYMTVKLIVNAMDPTSKQKKEAKRKAEEIMRKLRITEKVSLSEYEMMIASQLVEPSQLHTSWQDIAGLASVIQELKETVIFPVQQQHKLSSTKLIQPPKGVLLHGPPGCGKTLMARAVAKEAGARFINLDVASLTDKWYGESQKLSGAVFSLAKKIQPCIIFIDEIDSFLRVRATGDHEATAMMKAQFMQQWDGLSTDPNTCIIVMGATNRPTDVDKAILRRMPSAFHIGLPDVRQREQILQLVLNEEPTEDLDVAAIARKTESFSGSDLRELCRNAAMYRLRDYMRMNMEAAEANRDDNQSGNSDDSENYEDAMRPMTQSDFIQALGKMLESRVFTGGAPGRLSKIDLD